MHVIHDLQPLFDLIRSWKREGRRIGLVPTMGALHAGHGSLVTEALRHADKVIVTVFVNPTQFGPNEDLAAYPRTLEADVALCRERGAACVFAPKPEVMYPEGASTWVEETQLTQGLEGEYRPGHFRGVTTIVAKLFNIAQADVAVFGQKDAQQAAVIQRMGRDLLWPLQIVIAPTHREPDGLAMSSRNKYLSPAERQAATAISRGLFAARDAAAGGERSVDALLQLIREPIVASGGKPDYISINDPETLEPLSGVLSGRALASLAAWYGKARLLDNVYLEPEADG